MALNARGRARILLVEDNPDDVELTLRALERTDTEVETVVARDGLEALEYLLGDGSSTSNARPSVVLLDLKLPRVDGFEVLARLRADERTRRQQLHPQAGRLRPLPRRRPPAQHLLAAPERGAARRRLTVRRRPGRDVAGARR